MPSIRSAASITASGFIVTIAPFILLLLPNKTVNAWVPPRTADGGIDKSWETVQSMRQRLNIQYNYTPSLLNPEACRFVSEAECQHVDESLQQHAQTHVRHIQQRREIQQQQQQPEEDQQQHQQQHQQHNRDLQLSHSPNLGKIKVLILMIRFSDHTSDRNLVEKSTIEEIWDGEIMDWFKVNARGLYEMEPVVIDWITTDDTEKAYANDTQGVSSYLQRSMWPALDALDNRPGWDWSEYDSDQDGFLDSVVMMHSGVSAVVTPDPDCFGQEVMDRIWPHAWASINDGWISKDKSVQLNGYTVNSVYDAACDDVPLTSGLTAHEYMHTMNLVDLYDFGPEGKGCGAWDIMSHPYGADNSGTPGLLSAWSKMEAEWITPTLIDADGIYVAKAIHEENQAYRINIAPDYTTIDEYLLIENRQPIGFEANLWDKGLVIAHIDDAANAQKDKGWPGLAGWPENGHHYKVAILQKDGNYDLEKGNNTGDAGDMWQPGDVLGPGMEGTVYPNTDSYQAGYIVETGLTITVLSQDGNDITFEVGGFGKTATPQADTPKPAATDPTTPTIAPTGILGEYPDRWVLSRPPGPTRAPFGLPQFPVEEPGASDILFGRSSAISALNGLAASTLLSVGLYVVGSLCYMVY